MPKLASFTPLLLALAGLGGCARPEPPPARVVEWKTSPELIRLFGGEENLDEVRRAWGSSELSVVARDGLVASFAGMAGDDVAGLNKLLATADAYDGSLPTAGPFHADVRISFTGFRYHEDENIARGSGRPVVVALDLVAKQAEVRTGDQVHGRASFAPIAARLETYLREIGVNAPRRPK